MKRLTLNTFRGNETLAYISAIAFSLSPASMFISSFYAESLFALLTFTGMLCITRRQYIKASIVWGIASATRANAVMYAGYIIYELVVRNLIQGRSAKVSLTLFLYLDLITLNDT